MRSTNDNLQNPMRVDLLDTPYEQPLWKIAFVSRVTQFFYDHLQIKDPNTLYVITDDKNGRCYVGDTLVNRLRNHVGYLLGPGNRYGEYTMYMNCVTDYGPYLFEICRYDNPQKAINALDLYNKAGSHHPILLDIRASIISFIENDIPVNDFIIGIIAMFGYRDDPRLQDVIAAMRRNGASNHKDDIGRYAKVMLHGYLQKHKNPCYKYYSDIYDILVIYNFFRDEKYRKDPENAEFAQPIHKIFDAMTSTLLPRI